LTLADWRASRTARATFWIAAAFSLLMALLPHPPEVPGEPNDKVEHIVAFATLAALASFAYPRAAFLRLLIGLSLFGALIEVLQAIPVLQRDSDIWDWVADTAAVTVVLAIVWTLRRAASARGASG
jgi:VanZ family protein